jgi:capsular exopolysaccharide synthesis family protein
MCAAASGTYLLNDAMDAEADRRHPVKVHRPIASGAVSEPLAIALSVVLIVVSVAGAAILSGWVLVAVVASYITITVAYTIYLKREPVVELACVASGFVLRAVAGGGANIISRATAPSSPSGMSLTGTAAIGVLIGLALALALIFLIESLYQRVKSIEEFEREYRLPVLTAVPQSAFLDVPAGKRIDVLEPYRILRTAFDFAGVTRPVDTILVTSAVAAEGKSTVAVDFAHAIALTGRKVVLVELDLRHPSFLRHFNVSSARGLTMPLTGSAELQDVIMHPISSLPNLAVLPAGPLPPNPAELLSSQKISELLATLARDADVVIVDAPPLNPVSDAQVLLGNPAIQAVLVVARVGKTNREDVRRARAILDLHQVEPVGIVVTGLRDSHRYGYGPYTTSEAKAGSNGRPPAPRVAHGRKARRHATRDRVTAVERS